MPKGGVILSSTKMDGKLHANRAAHNECVANVQSKFSEDELNRETLIPESHDEGPNHKGL